ncbi:hypothetical protein SLI_3389 [Streptomyces lividans 1326]|uniref:Uncharacterized protein n=1 Tax=Streptomyces lividans 1326 TaxID=1200984 RepID=A0A7U9DQ41_STRLI|nr:hypothetical protein SLI_3389 [Streptomyces lividans 1326]
MGAGGAPSAPGRRTPPRRRHRRRAPAGTGHRLAGVTSTPVH